MPMTYSPAFFRGCIEMGAAPDLDWAMDCVPVDHVADAMVQLARNGVPASGTIWSIIWLTPGCGIGASAYCGCVFAATHLI